MNTLQELISMKEPKIMTYCLHGPHGDEYFANRKYLNQRITSLQKEYKLTRSEIGEMYKVDCTEILISEMRDEKSALIKKLKQRYPDMEVYIADELRSIYKNWFSSDKNLSKMN